ncbi:hypothetical protein AMTRI_Chr13g84870 [Amborella trichopoda]|uniref:GATA-type domain-containing protein n=1 Tax=Amborella trichopoda TaxID=13333 RepID=W1P8V4_AMBTC|nr:GATA transcription factor 16-like [Amborella trichopoda]ERN04353.1 hypothetical protein AMTR_s00147p00053080 [Amborella trichopoda]|eukprot:XP_020521893.1 GATA transcription factor 16-like [Amborella trichopoda]
MMPIDLTHHHHRHHEHGDDDGSAQSHVLLRHPIIRISWNSSHDHHNHEDHKHKNGFFSEKEAAVNARGKRATSSMEGCTDDSTNVNNLEGSTTSISVAMSRAIRACVDCNTTKTPLWRTGPAGPRSLCNACGIRYRKRRRMGLLESGFGGPNAVLKKEKSNQKRFGKRFLWGEEEQAAVLLMALSCGLNEKKMVELASFVNTFYGV